MSIMEFILLQASKKDCKDLLQRIADALELADRGLDLAETHEEISNVLYRFNTKNMKRTRYNIRRILGMGFTDDNEIERSK